MKQRRSIALALAPLALAACGGENETAPPPPPPTASIAQPPPPPPASTVEAPPPPPKPSMADMQKATIGAMAAAFNAHDAAKMGEAFAVDVTQANPEPDGLHESKGRDALVAEHAKLFKDVPDAAMKVVRVFQVGDVAIDEFVGTGGGGKVGFRGASVMWFNPDGLIKVDHTYFDEVTIGQQLGKAPGKPRPVATPPAGDATWIAASGSADEKKLDGALRANWPSLWPKKDIKGYEAVLADDAVHEDLGMQDAVGKKANVEELKLFAKAVPDMQIELTNVWTAGNFAIAEFVFSGTQKGALGPFKATGKKFTVHGLDVDEFKGDKWVKATTYDNAHEFLAQLGLMPTEHGAPSAKTDATPPPKKTK